MSNKLKEKRAIIGLTQVQVAKKADITERDYRRYECSDRKPNVLTAIRIAKALGTTVEELWGNSSTNANIHN